ncbi:MAG: cohesin domain-containing protein [Candidatus Anammoxibacter sp.]
MKRIFTGCFVVLLAIVFNIVPASAEPIVSLDVGDTTGLGIGDSLTVDIRIDGVADPDTVLGFEFDLDFDTTVFDAVSVVDGGFLTQPVFAVENDISGADVNFAEATLGVSTASGSGVLATVTFEILSIGPGGVLDVSGFDLNDVILSTTAITEPTDVTPTPEITPTPTVEPTPTLPPTGKSFTFNCENSMKRGPFLGLEKLTMNVGDTENCTLKLTNNEPGKTVEILSLLRKGFRSAIEIEPARSVTDNNGELKITITAIRKGRDWSAWAVRNKRGAFRFNKKTYDAGLAWGMFVEVK